MFEDFSTAKYIRRYNAGSMKGKELAKRLATRANRITDPELKNSITDEVR